MSGLPRRALPLVAAALLACGDAGSGALEIHDARVAASGHGPAGGFLVLDNGESRARVLVAVESPAAARVELHRSWLDGDVARMAPVASLEIPSRERIRLEPGGYHLMLFELRAQAGEEIPLRLHFQDGSEHEIAARVEGAAREAGDHAGHAH